jgi:sugar lactone lactonase YvrE
MTTPEIEIPQNTDEENVEKDDRRRRWLLLLLLLLLLCCCCTSYFMARYFLKPQPLPQMVPVVNQIPYPPTFKFLITGLDGPVGVAASPDGSRIYGTESENQRLIKMFDRNGNFLKSFAPFGTTPSNRKPAYIAIDAAGRLFVVDTYNNTINLFDADGNHLDGIIGKDISISEMVSAQIGGELPPGTLVFYNNTSKNIEYQLPGQPKQSIVGPDQTLWSPIGVRFDKDGNLLVTNVTIGKHEVLVYPAAAINGSWRDFSPQIKSFGVEGKENGQLSFPNSVVTDSKGNFYVSDGNNGRISFWTPDMQYKTFFGFGSSEISLNLPRGMWMDTKDRLHIVDAVGSVVRVFDVTGAEPVFLYNFGVYGIAEGEFNFPNDIFMEGTGRLYIADRENNRIQVWSY